MRVSSTNLIGIVVIIVQIIVDVRHQVEDEQHECHEVEGVEAIVPLPARTPGISLDLFRVRMIKRDLHRVNIFQERIQARSEC